MATVNKRSLIAAEVLSRLANISVAGGYINDIGLSGDEFRPLESMASAELPAAFHFDDGVEIAVQHMPNKVARVTYAVDVLCYVAEGANVSAFDADVKRAIASDNTLGGTCDNVEVRPQEFRTSPVSRTNGEFVRTFHITYSAVVSEGV